MWIWKMFSAVTEKYNKFIYSRLESQTKLDYNFKFAIQIFLGKDVHFVCWSLYHNRFFALIFE